ncbi:dolichyl-phosphate-mannose-protein mannosyltransferase [Nematocida displodere]|uniref:Dolichyl-phosphate-mannose--protein mannosyltransferase n=1 Tax=Nematocida displodere TaxID=1805483 RepID=A0A177ECY3_9MICR|nr:dolichyl-phosphate-mannose-protein mannosyltransferase [Nematocida displodere]
MEIERVKAGAIETTRIKPSPKDTAKKKRPESRTRPTTALIIWMLSLMVRLYRIERGNFVLWDEAHFGKFATHYLSREFFFDVHPPLGKLLTALSAYIYTIPKTFEFASGEAYPSEVDYGGMRVFHALFGSCVPVAAYFTMGALEYTHFTAAAISIVLVFDNALVAISRLILLDPFLLLFIMTAELFLSRIVMDNRRMGRFSGDLFGLGVSIGLAASVKWIGLMVVAHTGLFAAFALLQEVRARRKEAIYLFFRLAVTLIFLPVVVYLITFQVHFQILDTAGPGDGEMSSQFQARLKNNETLRNAEDLRYGNKVTLRNESAGTGLLHSHRDRYPEGGQQVTTYPHKDSNNHWKVLKVGTDPESVLPNEELVFYHPETTAYLTVEDRHSPLSRERLVLGQTKEEMDDTITSNAVFTLEAYAGTEIHPVQTQFYIKHKNYNCYVSYSGKKLPKWGHTQGEIFCSQKKTSSSLWNIELNEDGDSGPATSAVAPSRTLSLKDFLFHTVELNKAMNAANNSLVDDGSDTFGTTPSEWLFPKKWLKFNTWDGTSPRFAMVGNPLTWYLATANIIAVPFVFFALSLFRPEPSKNAYISQRGGQLYIVAGGWLIHYLPFFLLSRILYLHHYLSSLLFGVIGLGLVLEGRRLLTSVFVVLAVASFFLFSGFTYGYAGELSQHWSYGVLSHWNVFSGH